MTAHALHGELESTALYDVPGPRARRRHFLYGIISTVVILGLLAWILYLLFDTAQFTAAKWGPFTYKGIQELLLRGWATPSRPSCTPRCSP